RATEELGPVEFLAADPHNLLLIASMNQVYAISPAEPGRFLNSFRRASEMGSLTPRSSYTLLPAAYFKSILGARSARTLVLLGALAAGVLAVGTSVAVSAVPLLSMGYDSAARPFEPGPSQYLLLLPILGAMVFVFNLLFGMFLYRRSESQIMSYLLWGGSIFTALLLLAGVLAAAL
ncbi:MAG: hypothetical protein AAGU05_01650, partial [Anaerolineaceae bacterium]